MSEFRRPSEHEWEEVFERKKTYHKFIGEMDELFTKHFDDVDRGIVWDRKLPEQLKLEREKDGTYFTLVRSIIISKYGSCYTDYGLNVEETTPSKTVNHLYRINPGLGVRKLTPTYEQNEDIIEDGHLHDFAARVGDYRDFNDQPASFADVEKTLLRAHSAKPPVQTFQDIVHTHESNLTHQEEFFNGVLHIPDDDVKLEQEEREYAKMAVDFFNSSIDEIMDSNEEKVEKENATEVLEIIKRGEGGTLAINISRDRYGDFIDSRRVGMVYQDIHSTSTQLHFQVTNEELQSSKIKNDGRVEDYPAFMDPNSARNLIKFIRNPKID